MSAHTPGPWVVEKYLVDRHEREVDSTERGDLAVRLRVVADESPMVVADMVAGGPHDAHLIAAAPDLLAALQRAEKFIEDDTCRHDHEKAPALRFIRAAIAKAEGGR